MQPVLSNQTPEPTAPILPTAPVPPSEPLKPTRAYQLVQPVAPVHPVQRPPATSLTYRATQLTYLVLGVLEALMITRVVLKLLAANPASGFVRFVYNASAPLVAPFQGIFPTPSTQHSVLELSSLVAIAVYALIAWGIVGIISVLGRQQAGS